MNRLVLTAQLVERGAMRYTPAGLPALDLRLQHESTVSQDGSPRKVSMEIKALGIGAITQHLGALALGSQGTFAGFLATARNGRGLLFHVTALDFGLESSSPNVSQD
ncbi:primosomal replication protein N [Aquincola sp. S2]|uniref:Replication restart protein PriB n=1 Tax=Pseudaquabacterium terrae TaxID=2732868 RepID=A0ABX2EIX0_9BURK|nr:primosomal replication protein N [Aquabacterium terrae]NRF68568.1 primosomal replication protein N [Aquabacterium terrae]